MRVVAVVSLARSDYGIYLPILRQIRGDPALRLHLMVGGTHLSPAFGLTVRQILDDGFEIGARIDMLLSSDTPEGMAKSLGIGVLGFAQAYANRRPDMLLVLGDRYEMLAAAAAALPFNIPVAHAHGGESTEGAIDESVRHAITKMSHLHFAATAAYADRITQMGEEPWRVSVTGAPSLDNIRTIRELSCEELSRRHQIPLHPPFLLVTYHPVTLEYEQTGAQMNELLAALAPLECDLVFTYPNSDAGGRQIIDMVQKFTADRPRTHLVPNLGLESYFNFMRHAAAMVGNSSSGIVEAASFKLPVVNIGNRQAGRLRAGNVVDVGYGRTEIAGGITKAVSAEFRAGLALLTNPYGDGHAANRIVQRLKDVPIDRRLLTKRFIDLGAGNRAESVR
jgi:UDP-hydrolysing UDP-N-acetyl-D-glucosamine 2-epimerase